MFPVKNLARKGLTHLGLSEMADNLQMLFTSATSLMKIIVFYWRLLSNL